MEWCYRLCWGAWHNNNISVKINNNNAAKSEQSKQSARRGGNAEGWNSGREPPCSALAEYRWATFRLEVLFFFAGYWQAIAASAAAGGGGRSAQEEERLMLEGLVAEITC